jgi:hypothetical protein
MLVDECRATNPAFVYPRKRRLRFQIEVFLSADLQLTRDCSALDLSTTHPRWRCDALR